jgi:exopolysaccharide biosynthesis polyprenyl glycosylphosphotransferase
MAQAPGTLNTPIAAVPTRVNRVSLPFLRIQERRLLLSTADACIVAAVMTIAYNIWHADVHPVGNNMAQMPWAWVIGAAAVWLFISWLAGSYELDNADRMKPAIRTTLTVWFFAGIIALGCYWAFLKTYPRPALAIALVATPVAILVWRALYATTLKRPAGATRILVVGAANTVAALTEATQNRHDYFQVVGFASADDDREPAVGAASGGISTAISADQRAVAAVALGPTNRLGDILRQYDIHRIVVAPRQPMTHQLVASLSEAIERGLEVVDFNTAYEEMAGKVAVDHVGDSWLAALPTRPQTSSVEELAMRLLDIAGSIAGLLFTAVATVPIALAIVLESGFPVIYRQERLGRGGKVFTVFKFRSMRRDAESTGAAWATRNDSRATRVGRFLRRTHLDELPQFWNVLRGDMSLVGPRPERPEFTDSLADIIPFYRLRLSVRPGLTGLKQIKVGYASTPEEHLEVLRHDLYFIKHRSVALNLVIVARTLGSVIRRDGR